MSKKLICKECEIEFTLKDSELTFYQKKNFELPKRCKPCREKRKAQNAQRGI
jgi:hypothetical protein